MISNLIYLLRYISSDQGNHSAEYDENKIKNHNSSGSSAGALAISLNSGGGSVDSAVASTVVQPANVSNTGTVNVSDLSDPAQTKNSINVPASGGQISEGNDVDEDGYSIQPPKEVAWEENNENGKLRNETFHTFHYVKFIKR